MYTYRNASGETRRRLEEFELGTLFRPYVSSGMVRLEAGLRTEIRLLCACRNRPAHLAPVPEAKILDLARLQPSLNQVTNIYST